MCALWAVCAQLLMASEEEFERYYLLYRETEKAAKAIRKSHGDISYVLTLYSGWHIPHIETHYRVFGAHPEVGPPNRNESLNLGMLNAARMFVHKYY